jgi:methylenetetrahydrofolate dehydrogenase (NADP+)/methenyltetrahydrofolate cyclohydrolase
MVVWIRGDSLHKETKRWAAEHVRRLEERYGITPKLAVLLLNDDPVELETQKRYVSLKAKDVREVGGEVEVYELYKEPPEIREAVALKLIERLNNADDVTGIIIQKAPPALHQRGQAI